MMFFHARRATAIFLALSGLYVGCWAALAPQAFYEAFPGLHRAWVSVDGPFNEHLVRDVGGLYLGLAVTATFAVFSERDHANRVAGVAWSVFSALHLNYHATHLRQHEPVDQFLSVTVLVLTLAGALILLVPAPRRGSSAGPPGPETAARTN